jgi:hypothetical protein
MRSSGYVTFEFLQAIVERGSEWPPTAFWDLSQNPFFLFLDTVYRKKKNKIHFILEHLESSTLENCHLPLRILNRSVLDK